MKKAAAALFQLYQGLTRAHGIYYIEGKESGKGKQGGRAETVLETVSEGKWEAHLEGRVGLGIVPIRDDSTVVWGAIDIDVYPLDLTQLFRQVVKLDLPLIVLRTKSGGAHLTCFCSEAVSARLMRTRLIEMASALGYPKAEIFPKQVQLASERDVGNWLNMPYFDVGRTTRYAMYEDRVLSVEEFLQYAKKLAIDAAALEALKIEIGPDFNDGPPCLQVMARGPLEPGTRNEAMFAFGVYARTKYGHGWEAEFAKLNEHLCEPPLPKREINTLVKSLSRKEYFYPCKRAPCVNACNKELCRTREFGIGQQQDELDITIGALTKIDYGGKPLWVISVNGVRIELETDQLMVQAAFQRLCVDRLNLWPRKVKPATWQTLVQEKLATVEIIEPPPDSSEEGRFLAYLEQYLTTTALARTSDELLQGKPYTDEGTTYFRSNDLMDYLERAHFRGISQRGAWSILRKHNAVHKQLQIKGRCVMVWGVPEMKRQEEPHDVPELDDAREY